MTAYYVASGTKKEFDSGFRSGYLQIYKPKGVKLYASQHRREIEIEPGRKWAFKDLDSSRLIVESVTDQIGEFTLLNLDLYGVRRFSSNAQRERPRAKMFQLWTERAQVDLVLPNIRARDKGSDGNRVHVDAIGQGR